MITREKVKSRNFSREAFLKYFRGVGGIPCTDLCALDQNPGENEFFGAMRSIFRICPSKLRILAHFVAVFDPRTHPDRSGAEFCSRMVFSDPKLVVSDLNLAKLWVHFGCLGCLRPILGPLGPMGPRWGTTPLSLGCSKDLGTI